MSDDASNYHVFTSEGYVSLSESGDTVAVKILCDTGVTQSLIASNILPLSTQSSADLLHSGSRNGCDESATSSDTSSI